MKYIVATALSLDFGVLRMNSTRTGLKPFMEATTVHYDLKVGITLLVKYVGVSLQIFFLEHSLQVLVDHFLRLAVDPLGLALFLSH